MPRIPILMPQLGESIAEAVIVQVHVKPGEFVEADSEVIEVETNKAVMGVTTPCAGTIAEITARLDQSYVVGATLGYLEAAAEEMARLGLDTAEATAGAATAAASAGAASPAAVGTRGDGNGDAPATDTLHFRVSEDQQIEADEEDAPSRVRPTVQGLPVPANTTGASYLSPRMKARMEELGLNSSDLAGIAGSGSGGRVTIEDFEKFIAAIEKDKMTMASPMRIAVADSMRRSWTRPLATVGSPIAMDAMLQHRKATASKPGPALYAVRALALALAEDTAVAGRLIGNRIVHPNSIDIGFAVEVADGVLVPVIRAVDKKPLQDIVQEYNALVAMARDRRLPKDAAGPGIATVTNFGTFGIVWATPIPLPEQNLVLGLGKGRKKPIWDNALEEFVPVTEAEITLSFDHRILDGGAAGRLLARVGELLQTPETL